MMKTQHLKLYWPTDEGQDAVILLHGLFSSQKSMAKAANRLLSIGYHVINFGYPTFWNSIDSIAQSLLPTIKRLQSDGRIRSINFVTHSLGGILARYAIALSECSKLHRMVMMAPPNRGTHLTRVPLGPFAKCLPVIAELSESPESVPNRLQRPCGVEFGIIAAGSDIIVRPANTTLPYQQDHCVVDTSHFKLPYRNDAIDRAIEFLETGRFYPTTLADPASAAFHHAAHCAETSTRVRAA